MTTDRTRAIVEAAERLAKAIDAEAMHGDDPPPLVVAARLDLARAIALPEDPPVPEANLRAVYEAAERLVARNAEGGSLVEAWEALEASLALRAEPSPAWTITPPSEPGWYWALCRTDLSPRPFLARLNDAGLWHVEESEFSIPLDDVANWEWWPVRIEEPTA